MHPRKRGKGWKKISKNEGRKKNELNREKHRESEKKWWKKENVSTKMIAHMGRKKKKENLRRIKKTYGKWKT